MHNIWLKMIKYASKPIIFHSGPSFWLAARIILRFENSKVSLEAIFASFLVEKYIAVADISDSQNSVDNLSKSDCTAVSCDFHTSYPSCFWAAAASRWQRLLKNLHCWRIVQVLFVVTIFVTIKETRDQFKFQMGFWGRIKPLFGTRIKFLISLRTALSISIHFQHKAAW